MYKHSLDLIFYLIGDPSENELMLHSALVAFSDAVYMLLRNQVEKRGVLENLDLVLLCLDETIDDGCVLPIHQTLFVAVTCVVSQRHRRDRFRRHRVAREPAKGGQHGDRDQRADDHECVHDGEGEDAAEDSDAVNVDGLGLFISIRLGDFPVTVSAPGNMGSSREFTDRFL